jgi:hypothetical protein
MRRPGPLQELPLEHFFPPNPNVPKSPLKLWTGGKRPLSPGAPSTFSPAKRRILNAEGIFSPETLKSPVSLMARSPARFADLVRGPDSPARKLDFGLPKNHSQSTAGSSTVINSAASSQFEDDVLTTPTRTSSNTSINTLAPSPELLPKSASAPIASSSSLLLDGIPEMDDYFSPHPRHSAVHPSYIPTMIPRELPAPPDRQSVHYPGFDVLLDTHIPLLRARSASVDWADFGTDLKRDKEGCKENVPPRRKAKKAATAPNSSELTKAGLLSPGGKQREVERIWKAKSTPATPKKLSVGGWDGTVTPTPRRYGPGLVHDLTSPSRTTPVNLNERRERRRMLEEEVDEAGGDENTIDDAL